jgi:hypothetical protein
VDGIGAGRRDIGFEAALVSWTVYHRCNWRKMRQRQRTAVVRGDCLNKLGWLSSLAATAGVAVAAISHFKSLIN